VAAVSTDLEGEQLRLLEGKLDALSPSGGAGITGALGELARGEGLSYHRNVRPVLGNELVVGVPNLGARAPGGFVAAIQVRQEGLLQTALNRPRALRPARSIRGARVYRSRRGALLALNGDELVLADSARTLARALRQRATAGRLTRAVFEQRLGAGAQPALVRGYVRVSPADTARALDLRRAQLRRVPWIDALRSVAFTFSASPVGLSAQTTLNTAPGLREADLPLAPGAEAPPVIRRPREIVSSQRDPAHTFRFLLDAVEALAPGNELARERRRLERRLNVDLRRDVIDQMTGDSVATVSPNGRLASKNELRDPVAFAGTLRKLYRFMRPMLRETTGERRVSVRPRRGNRSLYLVSVGRERFTLGVLGGQFVLASDERQARRILGAAPVTLSGVSGSSVTRAYPRRFIDDPSSPAAERLGPLTASGEASTSKVRLGVSLGISDAPASSRPGRARRARAGRSEGLRARVYEAARSILGQ
jgi:hypothetical protein